MENRENPIFSEISSPFFDDYIQDFEVPFLKDSFHDSEQGSPFLDVGYQLPFESEYGAEATKEKVKWYQTILQVAAGYPQVPINGKHNDPITKEAMRDFQKRNNLGVSGYLQVDSNLALTQVALEWINGQSIQNRLGKRSNILKLAVKEFQQNNGLRVDGKVYKNTRKKMGEVLIKHLNERNANWTQAILRNVLGNSKVKINGNLKDSQTVDAIKQFRTKHNLSLSNDLDPSIYLAMVQIMLEKILKGKIDNKIGEWSEALKNSLLEFSEKFNFQLELRNPKGKFNFENTYWGDISREEFQLILLRRFIRENFREINLVRRLFPFKRDGRNNQCPPNQQRPIPANVFPEERNNNVRGLIINALRNRGLTNRQITRFENRSGFRGLMPIAQAFGNSFTNLLSRLNYSVDEILNPPSTYRRNRARNRTIVDHFREINDANIDDRAEFLAPRILLLIPGYFRELARIDQNMDKAFSLECIGWLLMNKIRDEINRQTNLQWWVPPNPSFVSLFPEDNIFVALVTDVVNRLINTHRLSSQNISLSSYQENLSIWENSLAGQQWRNEVGLGTEDDGFPFYPSIIGNYPIVQNFAQVRRDINVRWTRIRDRIMNNQQFNDRQRIRELTRCHNNQLGSPVNRVNLNGMELAISFPCLVSSSRTTNSIRVLAPVSVIVDRLFESIRNLGWNDLIFETQGALCFRGIKGGENEQDRLRRAQLLSNHFGIAIDLNVFENPQQQNANDHMDPRAIAIIESFGFRWGGCFRRTDPHHFEFDNNIIESL